MRKPFGKSMFHKLAESYKEDPLTIEVNKLIKEHKWEEPWFMDGYMEIFHQIMLYGDVIDTDKVKEIFEEALIVRP